MDAGRPMAASSLKRLPAHAIRAPVFQPQVPCQQTGFVVAPAPRSPTAASAAQQAPQPPAPQDDECAELSARKACATVVESIAEGLGIPRTASAAALGDLAAAAAEAEESTLSAAASEEEGASQHIRAPESDALDTLPPSATFVPCVGSPLSRRFTA